MAAGRGGVRRCLQQAQQVGISQQRRQAQHRRADRDRRNPAPASGSACAARSQFGQHLGDQRAHAPPLRPAPAGTAHAGSGRAPAPAPRGTGSAARRASCGSAAGAPARRRSRARPRSTSSGAATFSATAARTVTDGSCASALSTSRGVVWLAASFTLCRFVQILRPADIGSGHGRALVVADPPMAAAGALDLVHRQVGPAHQAVDVLATAGLAGGDADRQATARWRRPAARARRRGAHPAAAAPPVSAAVIASEPSIQVANSSPPSRATRSVDAPWRAACWRPGSAPHPPPRARRCRSGA